MHFFQGGCHKLIPAPIWGVDFNYFRTVRQLLINAKK